MNHAAKNSDGKGPVAATITRLYVIDEALSDGRWWTAALLLDKVNSYLNAYGYREVTKRQIQLDFRILGELCSRKYPDLTPDDSECKSEIPLFTEIYQYQGPPGRSARKYHTGISFFSREFSENEKIIINNLLPIIGSLSSQESLSRLKDIKSRSANSASLRTILDLGIKAPAGSCFAEICTALAEDKVVKLHYHTFDSEKRPIEIYPHLLKQYNGRWFLIASLNRNGFLLTFRIDQIDKVEILYHAKPSEAAQKSCCNCNFQDIVGVSVPQGAKIEEIVFWIGDQSYDYFITKPLHSSWDELTDEADLKFRREYPHLQGGHFISIWCVVNYELKQQLMMYMDALTVLKPDHLADEMREHVRNLYNNYNPGL